MEKTLTHFVSEFLKSESPYFFQTKETGRLESGQIQTSIRAILNRWEQLSLSVRERLVGILVPTPSEWIFADLACIEAGAISVPVPTDFSDAQLKNLLERVSVCLVADVFSEVRLAKILPDLPIHNLRTGTLNKPFGRGRLFPGMKKEGVLKIIHTSGTTSDPKGVLVSDSAIFRVLEKLRAKTRELGPIHALSTQNLSVFQEHLMALYLPMMTEGSTHFPDISTWNAEKMTKLSKIAFNASFFTPELLEVLLQSAQDLSQRGLPVKSSIFGNKMPLIVSGNAPIKSSTLEKLQSFGIPVYQGYGLSENTFFVSWNTPNENKVGSVGLPLEESSIKISDLGEVLVQSDTFFKGYLGPHKESVKIQDGYLHTGDVGYLDEEGFLFLTGRMGETLNPSQPF